MAEKDVLMGIIIIIIIIIYNNDDRRNIQIYYALLHLVYKLPLDQYDVMEKIIDIIFPDLDDKNIKIILDDTLSPKTFKIILNLPIEVSINSGERSFIMTELQ